MPGFVQRCPIEVYRLNLTLSYENALKKEAIIPNGHVKAIVTIYNNRDINMFKIALDVIVNLL